ncbi:MAG: hypothetical protein H6550_08405 [Chitinophagales bacterium]|nr:hypothetical protein [Chitinophagales bacterium]
MQQAKVSISQFATTWLEKGLSNQQIKTELLSIGVDERDIADMLKEISKMRQARNTANGLYFILAGAMLCLISCIITLMSAQTNAMVLYGFTSIGIVVVFVGLYKIFG